MISCALRYTCGLFLGLGSLHAANWELQQDVEGLQQTVGRLVLEMEALKSRNEELEKRLADCEAQIQILKKLPDAIELQKSEFKSTLQNFKQEVMAEVQTQVSSQKVVAPKKEVKILKTEPVAFTDNYPKEGVIYTVKPGDTLSKIANEHGSSVVDLQNANKIADPKMLQAGQELFVPNPQ